MLDRLDPKRALAVLLLAIAACGGVAPGDEVSADESSTADALSGTIAIGTELVTTANVNLRSGPGTANAVVRLLPAGSAVVTIATTGPTARFYNVRAGTDQGWVHGAYLAPRSAPAPGPASAPAAGRGFPTAGPWVSFYGSGAGLDLAKVARTFRIINLDADPEAGNFTDAQIAALKAGGQNRVISYLNVGSCETYRSYWSKCVATGALTTLYDGYPDEKWANLGNAAYQDLMVDQVAAKLAARGVDGFFLDNLEVVEHGAGATNGPCGASCAQGGLDLVWKLRQKFPGLLIVMQNATGPITRNGTTHGVTYRSLLDGISHEEVYSNGGDAQARQEMLAWKALGLTVNARPFWLAVEDYAGACSSAKAGAAAALRARAASDGLSSYVTDASAKQQKPCYWSDL
jgi:cysteinyl-tRNA synthetase